MNSFWTGFEKRAMSLPQGKGVLKAVAGGLEKATEKATHAPLPKVLDYSKMNAMTRRPPSGTLKYGPHGAEFHPEKSFEPHIKETSKEMSKLRAERAQRISEARQTHLNKGSTPYTYWQEALREPIHK